MRETIREGQQRWLDVGEAVLPDLTSLSLGGADKSSVRFVRQRTEIHYRNVYDGLVGERSRNSHKCFPGSRRHLTHRRDTTINAASHKLAPLRAAATGCCLYLASARFVTLFSLIGSRE
jgi:hypothetical protein